MKIDKIEKLLSWTMPRTSIRAKIRAYNEDREAACIQLAALKEENERLRKVLVGLQRTLQSLVKERPMLVARMGSSTTIGNHLAEAKAALEREEK